MPVSPLRQRATGAAGLLAAPFVFALAFAISSGQTQNLAASDPLVVIGSFAPTSTSPVPKQFRIVSYNLHGPPSKRIEDITRVLKSHETLKDAALFALQEVNRHHRDTAYKDMARELASALSMYYAYAVENPYKRGGGERGLAILSRFPMSQVERLVLPHEGPGGRRRIALGATIHLGPERLRVYTVHLETRLSVEKRGDQIAALLQQANLYRELPTVILGDFNTITGGAKKKMFKLMKAAGFSSPLPGDTMTFQRSFFVRLKLDWIWVRNLPVMQAKVEQDIRASDHRPIWAEIDLQQMLLDRPSGRE